MVIVTEMALVSSSVPQPHTRATGKRSLGKREEQKANKFTLDATNQFFGLGFSLQSGTITSSSLGTAPGLGCLMVEVVTHSRPFAERRTMSGCWSRLLHPSARLFGRVAMLPTLGVVHCGSPMQADPHTLSCSEKHQPSTGKAFRLPVTPASHICHVFRTTRRSQDDGFVDRSTGFPDRCLPFKNYTGVVMRPCPTPRSHGKAFHERSDF